MEQDIQKQKNIFFIKNKLFIIIWYMVYGIIFSIKHIMENILGGRGEAPPRKTINTDL